MSFFPQLFDWRQWRWRFVTSELQAGHRSFTLRELLGSLEAHRNRAIVQSPYLRSLISLVKDDLASAERFPLHHGGPDLPGAQALSAAEYEGWPLPPINTLGAPSLRMTPISNDTHGR